MESLYTSAIDTNKKVIKKGSVVEEAAIEAAGFGTFQIKPIALIKAIKPNIKNCQVSWF